MGRITDEHRYYEGVETYIDGETGEPRISAPARTHKAVSLEKEQRRRKGAEIREGLSEHHKEHGGFIFAFYEMKRGLSERFPDLTQSDYARLMFIGTYVGWQGAELTFRNGVKIDKKKLGELLAVSRNKFREFYGKLTGLGILEETDGGLKLAQDVFYRGGKEDLRRIANGFHYTRIYRETVRELYRMYNGRTIKQLGLIYAVLPYINFNYNIVSHNPDEYCEGQVTPMTTKELAEKLGYSKPEQLTKALRGIKYEGQRVFGFFESEDDARKKKIVVNPRVIYAGNGEKLDGIKILFR